MQCTKVFFTSIKQKMGSLNLNKILCFQIETTRIEKTSWRTLLPVGSRKYSYHIENPLDMDYLYNIQSFLLILSVKPGSLRRIQKKMFSHLYSLFSIFIFVCIQKVGNVLQKRKKTTRYIICMPNSLQNTNRFKQLVHFIAASFYGSKSPLT